MPILQRPTCTLHYLDDGQGEPVLVFLHGWCDDAEVWDAVVSHLREQFRCLRPDLRGHGGSSMPTDHAYFAEALGNDVAAICEAAGVRQPVLVGHSFGGGLAAELVERFPQFARGLVVIDQPLAGAGSSYADKDLAWEIRSPKTHPAFRERLKRSLMPPGTPEEVVREVLARARRTPVDVGLALWAPFFEATTGELRERERRARSAFRCVPSLNIDCKPRPAYHAMLREEAPGVEIDVIEGCHWIQLEHPETLADRLRRFVTRALRLSRSREP